MNKNVLGELDAQTADIDTTSKEILDSMKLEKSLPQEEPSEDKPDKTDNIDKDGLMKSIKDVVADTVKGMLKKSKETDEEETEEIDWNEEDEDTLEKSLGNDTEMKEYDAIPILKSLDKHLVKFGKVLSSFDSRLKKLEKSNTDNSEYVDKIAGNSLSHGKLLKAITAQMGTMLNGISNISNLPAGWKSQAVTNPKAQVLEKGNCPYNFDNEGSLLFPIDQTSQEYGVLKNQIMIAMEKGNISGNQVCTMDVGARIPKDLIPYVIPEEKRIEWGIN